MYNQAIFCRINIINICRINALNNERKGVNDGLVRTIEKCP